MKDILLAITGLALLCCVAYGMYYLTKTVSYSLFYEDMVQETVKEMVQNKCLK